MNHERQHIRIKRMKHRAKIPLMSHITFIDETGVRTAYPRPQYAPRLYLMLFLLSLLPWGIIAGALWLQARFTDIFVGMIIYGIFLFSGWFTICLSLVKNTTMTFLRETMYLRKRWCGITVRKEHYHLQYIQHVRAGSARGVVQWDYGGEPIGWTTDFDDAEMRVLIHHILAILTFHCHTVERIIFGATGSPDEDPYRVCHNPDVSGLTMPYFSLRQIMIYPETASFHQLERFLTYAVNSIGTAYLRKYVDVYIYGASERLHPNIRNSLTTLCKHVYTSEKEE